METQSQTTIKEHFDRFFNDHELVTFIITVTSVCLVSYLFALYIPALIVGILLAYLLDGLVNLLNKWGCPRGFAIPGTMIICILGIALLILVGLPKLVEQLTAFARQLPQSLEGLEERYKDMPDWLADSWHWDAIATQVGTWTKDTAETLLHATVTNFTGILTILIYMVMIPLMVFFLLHDKTKIIAWVNRFIPNSQMISALKNELDEQFGAYVRGKIIEGLTIFVLSFVAFLFLGVNYAFALAIGIGLSVIIPFVGAIVVTFPVIIVGLAQFGLSSDFWWLVGLYTVIQVFDAQILVPLLFSEVVKIHPVAIFVSILLFGSLWGIWGVFLRYSVSFTR